MSRGITLFTLLILGFGVATETQAQSQTSSAQQVCFDQLKSSTVSIPSFSPVHEQVKNLNYADVQSGFSDYYKNISSFGIDLRSPDFDMRVYSFGRETGYQHPPFSPFPTYTLSDKWKEPAKEFVIAEEYVRNPKTNERIFISCALMVIESPNLKGVTAERYLYDGELSSVLYTAPDNTFKAWYSRNDSYDHKDAWFVTWERLFVYPEATKNQYFDRYTVAEAFPVRKTDNLGNIVNDKKDLSGDKTLLDMPELKGYDTVFALNSYYQAIENSYPDFAKQLSLRGSIDYVTVKELLATRGVAGFASLWNSVLDPSGLTKYALLKQNGKLVEDNKDGIQQQDEVSQFYEEQLLKIKSQTLNSEAQRLLKEIPDRNPILEDDGEDLKVQPSFYQQYKTHLMVLGVIVAALLGALLVYLRKRRLTNENIIVQ